MYVGVKMHTYTHIQYGTHPVFLIRLMLPGPVTTLVYVRQKSSKTVKGAVLVFREHTAVLVDVSKNQGRL